MYSTYILSPRFNDSILFTALVTKKVLVTFSQIVAIATLLNGGIILWQTYYLLRQIQDRSNRQ